VLGDTVDLVVFFDDGFFSSRYWIKNMRALFASASDIVGASRPGGR
jgi:hypothetical protein